MAVHAAIICTGNARHITRGRAVRTVRLLPHDSLLPMYACMYACMYA